ncbi:MAG TPA: IS66 family insertion sequence element accessory protein TnpB [Candidatus Methylomirabilis sp.]|nr:IS66 family insertion sequence element accessory protein TnpB [Candidatus Methylomirabilis sp.]
MLLRGEVPRILAYRQAVDMRRSFDGLIALVESALGEDPLAGTMYVFVNRRGTIMKGVFWDRTGYVLVAKRLEHGRFVIPGDGRTYELSERALMLMLDGISLDRRKRVA